MAINKAALFEWLRDQRGYREGPRSNQQKYSPSVPGLEWSNFQPWCATFTCAGFLAAGGRANVDFPLTASCLQQVAWGRSRGRLHSRAKSGDLMMIGPGGGTHVEIVVKISGRYVTTIGGNTSGSWGGNYANGNGVYQKTRSMASAYGYVRPYYGKSSASGGIEGDMIGLRKGDSSKNGKKEQVIYLQKMLQFAGAKLPRYGADGDYGNETAKAVLDVRERAGSRAKKGWGDRISGHAAEQIFRMAVKGLTK